MAAYHHCSHPRTRHMARKCPAHTTVTPITDADRMPHLKESRMQPSSLPFAVPPLSNPSLLSNFPSSPSTISVKKALRPCHQAVTTVAVTSVARSLCPRTHRMVWRSPPILLQQCCAYRWKSVPGSLSYHRGLTVPRSRLGLEPILT